MPQTKTRQMLITIINDIPIEINMIRDRILSLYNHGTFETS